MNRRRLLSTTLRLCAAAALLPLSRGAFAQGVSTQGVSTPGASTRSALVKSKAEWKKLLSAGSYDVLFEEGTERAGTSALNHEKRKGTFVCIACSQPLFKSEAKFDSGTGWPSFFDVLPGAVEKKTDTQLFMPRTEYHCSHCGGHQGHVFDDGPKPTGLRYCNNGVALAFVLAGDKLPPLRT